MKIVIDKKEYEANDNETILDVCLRNKIEIPTLCYMKQFSPSSSCRMCLVEVVGQKNLVTACSFKVFENMEVVTLNEKIFEARKTNLELLLSNHNYDCKNCVRDKTCELQNLVKKYKADENRFCGEKLKSSIDNSSDCIVRDNSKCILCRRCVNACNNKQEIFAISQFNRGFSTQIGAPFEKSIKNSSCIGCGQCVLSCPTGALVENENLTTVQNLLKNEKKVVVAITAPAVRVGIGEELGMGYGANVESLLPNLLRRVGFKKVFDVVFGADLTVCEEAKELVERINSKGKLPMFTSCCPAWVDYISKNRPDLKENLSSCKSPHEMQGAIIKSYYAEKMGIDPKDIAVVSIMPCTAKKGEINLKHNSSAVGKDVDLVLTVREICYLVRKMHINLNTLVKESFDRLLAIGSGAGVIFGASGGVMEAALRTAYSLVCKEDLKDLVFENLRTDDEIKLATIDLKSTKLNVAVCNGIKSAQRLLKMIDKKEIKVDFVEVMTCPNGCVNGGGMPRVSAIVDKQKVVEERKKNLYKIDSQRALRLSHKNPEVIEFYNWQNNQKKKAKLHTK